MKIVIRDSRPKQDPEDPPLELWLEYGCSGNVILGAKRGDEGPYHLLTISNSGKTIRHFSISRKLGMAMDGDHSRIQVD